MRPFASLMLAVSALIALASLSSAQQNPPETHVVTVTSFEVPFTDLDKFWAVVDKYVVPQDKENPHVLHEYLGSHNWGDAKKTVWFITEYKDLAEIKASDDWGTKYFDEHYPEKSAERDSADTAFDEGFLKYFGEHQDNILSVNMKRLK